MTITKKRNGWDTTVSRDEAAYGIWSAKHWVPRRLMTLNAADDPITGNDRSYAPSVVAPWGVPRGTRNVPDLGVKVGATGVMNAED